jgi:hypothetical protein
MTEREQIESQIRDLLRLELPSVVMSNRLFSPPHGLFCRIGTTEEIRREIGRGELFRAAQDRINELECEELARVRTPRQAARPEPADVR